MSDSRSTFDKILTVVVLVVAAIILMIAIGVLSGYTVNGPQGDRLNQSLALEGLQDEEYRGVFNGLSVVPSASSSGTGEISAVLSRDNSMLSFSANVQNLSGPITNASFHIANPGVNGPVVRNITNSFVGDGFQEESIGNGIWMSSSTGGPESFSETTAGALKRGEIYVLISTEAFPAGEVRAQLVRSN